MSDFLKGLASGGASALADLGGSLVGTAFQSLIGPSWRTQARFQRDIQKQLMSHQAELNKQQYDYEFQKEAEYNSPSAERARLEAAGMNPALAYGSGAGGSGVQASVGSVSGGSVGQAKPLSLAENSLDLTSLAQIENMAAQNVYYKSEARNRNADAAEKEYDLWRRKHMDADGAYDLDFEAKSNAVELQRQDIISRKEQNAILHVNRRIREATEQTEIAMSQEEYNRLVEEVANLHYRNMYEQARGEKAKELVAKELALQLSLIGMLDAQAGLLRQQAKTEEEQTEIAKAEKLIYSNKAFMSGLVREAFDELSPSGTGLVSDDYKRAVKNQLDQLVKNSDIDRRYLSIVLNNVLSKIGTVLGAVRGMDNLINDLDF